MEIAGDVIGDTLTLNEHFVYDDGEKQQQVWHIRRVATDRYEGTAGDIDGVATGQAAGFAVQLALWLWATVLFANVAESIAEGRGKAAADSLRASRVTTKAKLIVDPTTGTVTLDGRELRAMTPSKD